MTYLKTLEALSLSNKGTFDSNSVQWSYGLINKDQNLEEIIWKTIPLKITSNGSIISSNNSIIVRHLNNCSVQLFGNQLIIKLIINNQKVLLFKLINKEEYLALVSTLTVWKCLRLDSVASKWNYKNLPIDLSSTVILKSDFKIFCPAIEEADTNNKRTEICPIFSHLNQNELWFNATGELKSNGLLNITVNGYLLFTINLKVLFNDEIRLLDKSIIESSHGLFIGKINELRALNGIQHDTSSLLLNEFDNHSKFENCDRILIDFGNKFDLKNWFINLNQFTKIEYFGNSLLNINLNLLKSFNLEILEANFNSFLGSYIYCELHVWGHCWFKTNTIKNDDNNTFFWKESLISTLPYLTNNCKLVLKRANNMKDQHFSDEIIGFCYLDLSTETHLFDKLSIYNIKNNEIGSLLVNVNSKHLNLLQFNDYKIFEQILVNLDIKDLIKFIHKNDQLNSINLIDISTTLLNIYQLLDLDLKYINELIDYELNSNSNLNSNTIFRGNSLLTVSIEEYSTRIGSNYLEKLLIDIIDDIEFSNACLDPKTSDGYKSLLDYCERIWTRIYTTTNDLPKDLKSIWGTIRNSVELKSNNEMSLNAICSFIFLRFICPPILNPKLFNLSKSHKVGNVSKFLTLIAKVLITFSSRSKFSNIKDSTLLNLNKDFIEKHQNELLTFYDKVTLRKVDLNECKLDLNPSKKQQNLLTPSYLKSNLKFIPMSQSLPNEKIINFTKLIKYVNENIENENNENSEIMKLDDICQFDDEENFFNYNANDDEYPNLNQMLISNAKTTVKELINESVSIFNKMSDLKSKLLNFETIAQFTSDSYNTFAKLIFQSIYFDSNLNLILNDEAFHNSIPCDNTIDKDLSSIMTKSSLFEQEYQVQLLQQQQQQQSHYSVSMKKSRSTSSTFSTSSSLLKSASTKRFTIISSMTPSNNKNVIDSSNFSSKTSRSTSHSSASTSSSGTSFCKENEEKGSLDKRKSMHIFSKFLTKKKPVY